MYSKKIISSLIVTLISLNFAMYAVEMDLEKIIQDVSCEYFSEGYDKSFEIFGNMKDCECKIEENEVSGYTKICLCAKHFQVLETWMETRSKSGTGAKKDKVNKAVIDRGNAPCQNPNYTDKDLGNIFMGILCKYFYVDGNKSLENSDCAKSCGCKILKNKDHDCTEIYLCKVHSRVVEAWGKRVLKSEEDTTIDASTQIITDSCGCRITIESCGCTRIDMCEEHLKFFEDWCARCSKSVADTNKVVGNQTTSDDIKLEDINLEDIKELSN